MSENSSLKKLKWPGFLLIGLTLLNTVVWIRLLELLWSSTGHTRTFGGSESWIRYLSLGLVSGEELLNHPAPGMIMIVVNVGLTLSLISFYGIAHMMGGKRYYLSRFSVYLLMIPFISPLFFLGIPAGLWTLHRLKQDSTRKIFQNTGHE